MKKAKYSVESRFSFYIIFFFIVIVFIMILAVNFIFNNITKTSSEDYALFYSDESVKVLNTYLNQEIALVSLAARSGALAEWFTDEQSMEKKAAAYSEMINYADMLYNASLYFVIGYSLNEYSIGKGASFEEFNPFNQINPDIEYDQWYYKCIKSENDYTVSIDIDKVTNQRRLYINHKVLHKGELLGVFCSSLLFDAVLDEVFSQYDSDRSNTFFNSKSLFNVSNLRPLLFTMLAALIVYSVVITLLGRRLIFIPFQKLMVSLDQSGANKNGPVYGCDLQNEFGEMSRTIQSLRENLTVQNNELRIAIKNAEDANKAKSMFLSNLNHEMRTPMNVIVGLTGLMLEDENLTVNLKENLIKVNAAGSTLLGLINDVLNISKIEAGKLELIPVQYELPSFINDIITLNMIRTNEKNITFQLNIKEDLFFCLLGDDLRIKQIINNLLSNAVKYTQHGTITLGVFTERADGQNVRMSVYVSDTGIGIKEEDIKKLFVDFAQVDTQTNRMIEGTGLGLAITKRLTQMMDGEIEVESEYGKGTIFRLRICQGYVNDKRIGAETADRLCSFRYTEDKHGAGKKFKRSDLSFARVLVVDDIQINLDVAAGLLGKYKMQVDCVLSGEEAVERIRLGDPLYNAIFMDHMMPGMDGMETTAAIRNLESEYAKKIPIIALTANAVQGSEDLFYANGFQAFIPKPINMTHLDSVINKWIGTGRKGIEE